MRTLVPRPARGRLKLYIGSAAGVGKSYRMLQEAHDLRRRGVDVVVGVIETHGRRETAAQVGDLEVVPLSQIHYRGVTLQELDLDALLVRAPQIALIDELAHSNVPGVRNTKRWEDVLTLLDAGVSVISAMNVQHIESLNPVVEQTLGVSVRETVPDWVLARADQVVSIDLPADDLRQRLLDGKIYAPEKVPTALEHFFTEENLTTLRELALREVASSVDREREVIVRRESGRPVPATRAHDRIMVAMASRPTKTAALLRKASRIAGRLNTDWYCVYVQTAAERADRIDATRQRHLVDNIQLAERMGAEYVKLIGEDIAKTLTQFANEHGVALLLVGQSHRQWWQRVRRPSVVASLLRSHPGLDVLVVADDGRIAASSVSAASEIPRSDNIVPSEMNARGTIGASVDRDALSTAGEVRGSVAREVPGAVLERIASSVSEQLEEARLALHILQTSPFGELNENQEELVSTAREASEHANRDLRQFARLIALAQERREATHESVAVSTLFEAPLAIANVSAQSRGIAVHVHVDRDIAPVFVDRIAIQEALSLMLTALVDAAGHGSDVHVVAEERPGAITVRITPGFSDLRTTSLSLMLAEALLQSQAIPVAIGTTHLSMQFPMPPARVWQNTAAHSVQQ